MSWVNNNVISIISIINTIDDEICACTDNNAFIELYDEKRYWYVELERLGYYDDDFASWY